MSVVRVKMQCTHWKGWHSDIWMNTQKFHRLQSFFDFIKVEKILKGSLDLIQSPSLSMKIQVIGDVHTTLSKSKYNKYLCKQFGTCPHQMSKKELNIGLKFWNGFECISKGEVR